MKQKKYRTSFSGISCCQYRNSTYAGIEKADFNLLIANAARLWGRDDDTRLKPLKEELEGTPLFMYLNNADREVVESFTGELPPHTPVHSFFSRLAQLGLTSKSAAVK